MKTLKTNEEFKEFVSQFWKTNEKPYAFGIGLPILDENDEIIAVKWLTINVEENMGTAAVLMHAMEISADNIIDTYFSSFLKDDKHHANIEALNFIGFDIPIVRFYKTKESLTNKSPIDFIDVHFRLCLLSRGYFQPNQLNLDGMFGLLPNLIWTTDYAYTITDYNRSWYKIQNEGGYPLAQDKIPPMYWANPAISGVRVANTTMLRNGAHLAEYTTVMHYGFINHNAGTLGKSMVEGRIPAGTTIDSGTDIGAGAGFLGTLSGGNNKQLSTGEDNLVGAMAECGIILGHGNQIAAGVTILSNTKVFDTHDDTWKSGESFDGCNNTLFLFNTREGRMEARSVKNPVELNEELHKN